MRFYQRYAYFFSASVLRTAITILVLPFATRILDADDYGIQALIQSLVFLVLSFTGVGVDYLLNYYFLDQDLEKRGELVSTLLIISTVLFVVSSGLFMLGWYSLSGFFPVVANIPVNYVWLTLLSIGLTIPWTVAAPVLTLTKQANLFAIILAIESIAGAAALLIALFVFGLKTSALFIAGVIGAGGNAVVAMLVMRDYLRPRANLYWMRMILQFIPSGLASTLSWRGYEALRNSLLSGFIGLTELGIFSHSYKYQQMVFLYAKGVARGASPTSLEEAKTPPYHFTKTRVAWTALHISFVVIGVLFASVGRDMIGLLTNNKFNDAAPLAALWMLFLIVQYSGQPAQALLLVNNDGIFMQWAQFASRIVAVVIMIIAIPFIGVAGAILTELVWMGIYRIAIGLRSRRFITRVFFEKWILLGSALIILSMWIQTLLPDSLSARIGLAIVTILITAGFAYPDIRYSWKIVVDTFIKGRAQAEEAITEKATG